MSAVTEEHSSTNVATAPPYPAAMTVSGNAWHSQLVASGPVPLIHPETYIGLLDSNDIVLHDSTASRIHAVIRWTADGYIVQDLGSRSGTLINGQEISGPAPLLPGQQLRVGSTDLLFQAVRIQESNELGSSPTLNPSSGSLVHGIPTKQPFEVAVEAAMTTETINSAIHHAQSSSYGRWISQQVPRFYWRIFVIGLVAYFAASRVLSSTHNTNLVPLVTLLGSMLVPVTFVVFCWEQRAFADFPPTVVGLAFVVGSTVGLLAAAVLEPKFVIGAGFGAALIIALIEETAKASAALWFLGDNRRYREFDGLVLGAAVGMGFAALETAGYGFSFFLYGFVANAQSQGSTYDSALSAGIGQMIHVLDVRMLLAAFGHGVWTAIICATIWRERRESSAPRLMSSFVPAYAISMLLGNLWGAAPGGAAIGRAVDRSLANLRISSSVVAAYVGVVLLHAFWDVSDSYLLYIIYGAIGLFVLRFLIDESLERARLGFEAPPPPPLPLSLLIYTIHMFRRIKRPVAEAIAFAAAAEAGLSSAMARATANVATTGATIGPATYPAQPASTLGTPSVPSNSGVITADEPTTDDSPVESATTSSVSTGMITPRGVVAESSASTPPVSRACTNCGTDIPESAIFCPRCGTHVPE
ncbi:MAG TPA: PrsW family glutamic-type intramembrane protease [Nitrolancea sp.]|nr:PrsW family glutamic-type intramembrane protease [Nitrolancea sp.]